MTLLVVIFGPSNSFCGEVGWGSCPGSTPGSSASGSSPSPILWLVGGKLFLLRQFLGFKTALSEAIFGPLDPFLAGSIRPSPSPSSRWGAVSSPTLVLVG